MHVALTIAGSDSGGGAGVQADLKTFHQFGVYGTSVITAITAQNTVGVQAWEAVSPAMVQSQIAAVASDLRPAAFKTGMLPNRGIIEVVADAIRHHGLDSYVLDPVLIATSGDHLTDGDAAGAIRSALVPLAAIVTPNGDEVKALTGISITGDREMRQAAESLLAMGASAVLIKGGHVATDSETVTDLFYDGEFRVFSHQRLPARNTHGTGCTLSAAITARLATGSSMHDAVASAIDFVHAAIATAPGLGGGHGPLNHFAVSSAATNSRTSD
ncbi:MAG: bifunctional hydroxymethylpyrimidine kinase/phosphomethylpyrimidine kinase [Gemmatimonadaceae bacterium]